MSTTLTIKFTATLEGDGSGPNPATEGHLTCTGFGDQADLELDLNGAAANWVGNQQADFLRDFLLYLLISGKDPRPEAQHGTPLA